MTGEEFYNFFEDELRAKNQQVSFSRTMFLKLYNACVANNAGTILQAVDSEGVTNGALFVVWDSNAMYALTYAFPDKYRNSGVGDLLMFSAIKLAATVTKTFDFEGSMIENVEQSYRRFGATPVEYFQISRINNPLLKILHQFKPLFWYCLNAWWIECVKKFEWLIDWLKFSIFPYDWPNKKFCAILSELTIIEWLLINE